MDDIPFLIKHFHEQLDTEKTPEDIPEKIIKVFLNYHWPGNVRELQNALARYFTFGQIDLFQDLPSSQPNSFYKMTEKQCPGQPILKSAVATLEKKMIAEALFQYAGNKSKAAEYLGVPKRSFIRKIRNYGLR